MASKPKQCGFELLEERIGKVTWFGTGRGYYQRPPRRHNHHNETLQYVQQFTVGCGWGKELFFVVVPFRYGSARHYIAQIVYCIA